MRRTSIVRLALAGSFALAGLSFAQEHSHEVAERNRPSPANSRSPAVELSSLLAASDQAVRAIEQAVGNNDTRALTAWTRVYAAAAAAMETYLEETAPGRLPKDLPRLEKALSRQKDILERLAEPSSTGSREPLVVALDANNCALEAVGAARADIGELRAEGHHRSQRSHGCGRH